MATIARLLSDGTYLTSTKFDEVTKTSNSMSSTAIYTAGLDEITLRGSSIAKSETSDGKLLVANYFDEVTIANAAIPTIDGLIFDLDVATYTGLSANFSGSNNLSVPNSTTLNPGTGDFTIEFWTRLTSTTNNASFYRANNGGVDIFMNGSGRLAMGQAQISTLITDTVTMTTGAWVHIAAVRISGVTRLYKNGVQVGSAGDATNYVTDSVNYIGSQGSFRITGYMSNLRVVIGLGVYTGAFTPPTSALAVTQNSGTNISAITVGQTKLLLPLTTTPFTDISTNNITVTNTGSVNSSLISPFTITDATGTYALSITNAGSISWNSSNGGYFSKSNNVGTDVIIGGPNYSSTSQSYSVFMAYDVNTTAGGRLLNTANEATNDWLLGSYFSSSYYKNVWYPNASLNLAVDSYTIDSGWNFIWATYDATTGTATLYIASSTVNNTSGPAAYYKQAIYGVSARGFNQLRLWSRSGGGEVQSGKIGFIKVYNRAITLAETQTLWTQYHTRFGI